ncbi:sentrin-specific protease 8 [Cephus cinctus]|uniref:Sentrin-specific protease 8 n=1 Tax=Cephus cinctus TaxID=211228 RepID=A0AAJ7C1B8_CEPCN|nr:sentrin-specific protease 8 [Cephus cinctus]XP_015599375.1 sentrin-specific protease 8 [Cephus cinctus]XP_015599377.1 sentrin-specific protease 8 [Cephus cinctus]XP_015599378.1 sentrin-specific protease 8 [Cephus cinctus]XP_024942831.1 sentrin-specific protease 8 [Cephus cinctus]XP_024942832.1 sentrin-specific protease 8 [Cephus cinctus]XP_024942833.1 sentrin-specific protease 8 [Cephus cinctus]XP_024942834.1 sentrin-specific protease 8 [Cephus cinctus]
MSRNDKKLNDVVLSYYDCLLRRADVNLLKGPCWLNDALVGFYFEYLNRKFQDADTNKSLFISPEMTQLLKLSDISEYDIFLEPINVSSSAFVFFPLNNCDSRVNAGGSHWSLLVFSRPEKICFHFDSSKGINRDIAKEFSRKIMDYLLGKGLGSFTEVNCPQQDNGYDCGLFVLCFTDILSYHIKDNKKIDKCNFDTVKNTVRSKRQSLLEFVNELSDNS